MSVYTCCQKAWLAGLKLVCNAGVLTHTASPFGYLCAMPGRHSIVAIAKFHTERGRHRYSIPLQRLKEAGTPVARRPIDSRRGSQIGQPNPILSAGQRGAAGRAVNCVLFVLTVTRYALALPCPSRAP
jgi:hypothetical protein